MKFPFVECVAIFGLFSAVLFFVPQAEAGLVEDLRSGKSNLQTSLEAVSQIDTSIYKYFRYEISKPDFRAIVTWRDSAWNRGTYSARSAEAAIERLVQNCMEKNVKC